MIDREQVIKDVEGWIDMNETEEDQSWKCASAIVDKVIIPLLAEHQDQNIQMQIASVVDANGAMYQASIKRQRASIDRLLEERRQLKERLSDVDKV